MLGECVAIPTETVYGLAANAFNDLAVAKIFEIKQRPTFDPLIVHTDSLAKIRNIVLDLPDAAYLLAEAFWPGPLTLLLPKADCISNLVTSGLERVAVRIPHHPLALELLSILDFPLAAPSANPFGYISPTTAQHVYDQLHGKIDMILDGGNSQVGIESTIIGFANGLPTVYRLGGLSVEAIQKIVGPVEVMPHSSSSPQSPGMLLSHYAPRKPLIFQDLKKCLSICPTSQVGVICFNEPVPEISVENQYLLSPSGSLIEAAAQLFSVMRILDQAPYQVIFAAEFPNHGLGLAINDRLRRASAR